MGYGSAQRVRPSPRWQAPRAATAEWRQGPKKLPRTVPPKVPASNRERQRMVEATYCFLAKQVGQGAAALKQTPSDRLYQLVARARCNPGEARRLLAKLLRLEPGRSATAGEKGGH